MIALKRDFRRGLMRDLLVGKRRFPEFGAPSDGRSPPEGWQLASLGMLADIRVSTVDKHTRANHTRVRLCNYLDVWRRPLIYDHFDFMRSTASPEEINRFGLISGDVLLTKDSETREEIAEPAFVVTANSDLVLGYHCALLRPDHDVIDGHFLASQLGHPKFRQQFIRAAQGATRYGLTMSALKRATVWVPSPEEQVRISRVEWFLLHEIELLAATPPFDSTASDDNILDRTEVSEAQGIVSHDDS